MLQVRRLPRIDHGDRVDHGDRFEHRECLVLSLLSSSSLRALLVNLRTHFLQTSRLGSFNRLRSYCWALVHSRNKTDVILGLQLVEALLSHPEDGLNHRELLYLKAVGLYRRGENLDARQTLKELIEAHPDFRQAETLLEHVESEVVKDGIVGLTAGAAILGVVTTVAIAAASGSRKR